MSCNSQCAKIHVKLRTHYLCPPAVDTGVILDARVHGRWSQVSCFDPCPPAVVTGSVYRAPVFTGRVGKKHGHAMLFCQHGP